MSASAFADWMAATQLRVEQGLARHLPPATSTPTRLHDAMRYATLGGGKRVRPLLCHAAGAVFGFSEALLLTIVAGASGATLLDARGRTG